MESDPHVQVMEMSYEAIAEGILHFCASTIMYWAFFPHKFDPVLKVNLTLVLLSGSSDQFLTCLKWYLTPMSRS